MKKTFDVKWDKIYSNGQQLNKYPYSGLVTFYHKYFSNKKNNKVLEIGCGYGNNLKFISYFNHNIYGFDASSKVLNLTKKRFKDESIECDLSVQDFTNINYKSNFFDLVINREVLQHSSKDNALLGMKECYRTLKKGGLFYSTFKSNLNSEEYLNRSYTYSYNIIELEELYKLSKFKINEIVLITNTDYKKTPIDQYSLWEVIAKKN